MGDACGKPTTGPLDYGQGYPCARAAGHDGVCRSWLTGDETRDAELAALRADLARVTAALLVWQDSFKTATEIAAQNGRERDAARAQVRELLKVARAAVAWKQSVARPMFNVLGTSVVQPLWDSVDALPPSMLEEPSDVLGLTPTEATAQQSEPYHPDPEIDAEVRTDKAMGRAADEVSGILEGWHRGWKEPSDG